jgi:RNA polymerase sigma factor (sigma-70 family)
MTPPDDEIARLFKAHAPALLLYARQWADAATAQDIVQGVFVRLLSGHRLPPDARPWLFQCVRHEAISHWRSRQRRTKREQSVAQARSIWFVLRPEDRLDARFAQEALATLPAVQREVVVLRIWSGMTLPRIAEITGLALSNVHSQYHAALMALRERLVVPCKDSSLTKRNES